MREHPRKAEARMNPDRLETLRRKVALGYYDRSEVGREVARRILDSGDL